jgi:hypothetical protein
MPGRIIVTRRGGDAAVQPHPAREARGVCPGCRTLAEARIENVRLRRRVEELEAQVRQQRSLGQVTSRLQTLADAPVPESMAPTETVPAPSIVEIPISRNDRW